MKYHTLAGNIYSGQYEEKPDLFKKDLFEHIITHCREVEERTGRKIVVDHFTFYDLPSIDTTDPDSLDNMVVMIKNYLLS